MGRVGCATQRPTGLTVGCPGSDRGTRPGLNPERNQGHHQELPAVAGEQRTMLDRRLLARLGFARRHGAIPANQGTGSHRVVSQVPAICDLAVSCLPVLRIAVRK